MGAEILRNELLRHAVHAHRLPSQVWSNLPAAAKHQQLQSSSLRSSLITMKAEAVIRSYSYRYRRRFG